MLNKIRDGHESAGSVFEDLVPLLDSCRDSLRISGVDQCFARMEGYLRQFDPKYGREDHLYSSVMDDAKYYATQPQEKMELPAELRTPGEGPPSNWRRIAREKGWKWALFNDRTDGRMRLVIHIRQAGYDQILVYWGGSCANLDSFNGLQMQVNIREENGKPLDHPIPHYRSFDVHYENPPTLNPHGRDRCVTCHLNGPRNIVPASPPCRATETSPGTTLAQINSGILIQGKTVDLSRYYDLKYFPHFASFAGAESCAGCHDNKTRNPMAFNIDENGQFNMKSARRRVVEEKQMPPGSSLPTHQREDLVQKMADGYNHALASWMEESSCSPKVILNVSSGPGTAGFNGGDEDAAAPADITKPEKENSE